MHDSKPAAYQAGRKELSVYSSLTAVPPPEIPPPRLGVMFFRTDRASPATNRILATGSGRAGSQRHSAAYSGCLVGSGRPIVGRRA
jgi:hypothetical protein